MDIQKTPDVLPRQIYDISADLNHLDLTHSYGLFRRMTGLDGRPEVIIESATSPNARRWHEIEFHYKPGNLESTPKFALPHQPRLDWQMWFAALGSYQHNPWLISLLYRILQDEPAVLTLLDLSNRKAKAKPPKVVRALHYKYRFTEFGLVLANIQSYEDTNKMRNWWRRHYDQDYVPEVTMDDLKGIMINFGYLDKEGNNLKDPSSNENLEKILMILRKLSQNVPHHLLVQTLLLALFPLYWSLKKN